MSSRPARDPPVRPRRPGAGQLVHRESRRPPRDQVRATLSRLTLPPTSSPLSKPNLFKRQKLRGTSSKNTILKSISVIITTYNRASVIGRAINSVLRQTLLPTEIIVVDDGSEDNTELVISEFIHKIKYIRTTNQGISRSRNLGINKSTSDWICFLDSDDIWHPQKLEYQQRALLLTRTRICFCRSIDESGMPLDDLYAYTSKICNVDFLKYHPFEMGILRTQRHVYLQSAFVERRLLIECDLFDNSLYVAEDTKLVYLLSFRESYIIINRNLIGVSRCPSRSGISEDRNPVMTLERYACYRRVQNEILNRSSNIDKKTRNIVKRRIIYFQSREAEFLFRIGRTDEAISKAKPCLYKLFSLKIQTRIIYLILRYLLLNRLAFF